MRDLFAAKGVDKIEFYVDKIEELLYVLIIYQLFTTRDQGRLLSVPPRP